MTGFVLLDDVEIINDPSINPSLYPILPFPPPSQRVTSNDPPPTYTRRPSLHSSVVSLTSHGPTTLRASTALITSSRDACLRVWDLTTPSQPTCTGLLEGHTEWISSILALHDQRTLISASADTTVRLWDLQTGLCIHTLARHSDYVEALAYSPHAHLLASAGLSNQLYLWRLDAAYPTPTECLSLPSHSAEACALHLRYGYGRDGHDAGYGRDR